MTTITGTFAPRAQRSAVQRHRVDPTPLSMIAGILLVVITLLVANNHPVAVPGRSAANIGVAAVVLHKAAQASDAAAAKAERATVRAERTQWHELFDCWRQAHQRGLDPSMCRISRP